MEESGSKINFDIPKWEFLNVGGVCKKHKIKAKGLMKFPPKKEEEVYTVNNKKYLKIFSADKLVNSLQPNK